MYIRNRMQLTCTEWLQSLGIVTTVRRNHKYAVRKLNICHCIAFFILVAVS